MSLLKVLDISGTGMSAQSVRLNTTASNLANANNVSSNLEKTYKSRQPVFAAELNRARGGLDSSVGVKVLGIVESTAELKNEYAPNHPKADKDGFIYHSNVNVMEEMANMISASRSYQTNVQIADAAKQMLSRTLQMGKG
ncbi:flagellar basal body rod protein FlgC [Psychromonas algicola]|uniref:flagellar basal body rod protein FlgC n=1 Tax=Psychromonas algicola TaxID=2555642 RepID=UPI001068AB6A|nr:flagellar basal body rod protein FlgC [Psychromonas sp. RZ5]TEW46017.1 flagellar basal body rod protein FlgC [Psychromonas sp. RZ5]